MIISWVTIVIDFYIYERKLLQLFKIMTNFYIIIIMIY